MAGAISAGAANSAAGGQQVGNDKNQGGGKGTAGGGTKGPISPGAALHQAGAVSPVGSGPAPTKATSGNATTADAQIAAKYGLTTDQLIQAARGLSNQISDANDSGEQDTFGNSIGKGVLGQLLGLRELDPAASPALTEKAWNEELERARLGGALPEWGNSAHWGFDPAVPAANVAGAFSPLPGTGFLLNQGNNLIGKPLETDVGPNVLAPDQTTNYLGNPSQVSVGKVSGALPPGFQPTGGAGGASSGAGAQIPSSTPSGAVGSPASQPVQQAAANQAPTQQPTKTGGITAIGQQSPGGRTIISGSNTVQWPWNMVNA